MEDQLSGIVILCKVVDNYGDAGFVYRLAQAIRARESALPICIIVDGLESFAALAPGLDPSLPRQDYRGWTVLAWNCQDAELVSAPLCPVILEAFSCGRPPWLEELLFDSGRKSLVHIVSIEYLTAEPYAGELHRMPSLTRSSWVKKWFFMPGFTSGTGGLILGGGSGTRPDFLKEIKAALPPEPGYAVEDGFWILIFGYERDYSPLVADLGLFHARRLKQGQSPLLVFAAAGKSQGPFFSAWEAEGRPFPLVKLPFLAQESWDSLQALCDFSLVRGEDSLARAALAAKPFLWQAYPQEGRHQLVKVDAFLRLLAPPPSPEPLSALERLYRAINDRDSDSEETQGAEELLPVLLAYDALLPLFQAFGQRLWANGDLAAHLLTFLREIV